MILLTIIAIINECKADYVWSKTGPDKTFATEKDILSRTSFGESIGIINGYAIIGAYSDNNVEAGAAYIYEKASSGTWNLAQKLQGASQTGNFGSAVAISNGYAIIGANQEDNNNGAAYIYEQASNGTWYFAQRFKSTSKNPSKFGKAVAISHGYAIIGTEREDALKGAAYIYERASNGIWNLAKRIEGTSQNQGLFGSAVAISNGYAIIGAWGENNDAGAAYIYKRACDGTWNLEQSFKGTEADGLLGGPNAVGISNEYAIIGASAEDNKAGAAYLYERACNGKWNLAKKLQGAGQTDGFFGSAVAISNGYAIIGTDREDNKNGAVYTYRRDINGVWQLSQKLGFMSGYGSTVAISNGYILIGSIKTKKVYFYDGNNNGLCECL